MRWTALILAAAMPFAASSASATTVTVSGQVGPWDVALNPGYSYGDGAELAPASVSVTSGLSYVVQYVSGTTSSNPIDPLEDANGYTFFPPLTVHSPGHYASTAPYLNELVGTFADTNGVIIGTPFVIGNGPLTLLAPAGAGLLQLGINDDKYTDNFGALQVSVSAAPEPASWAMMIGGFGLAGGALRTRARRVRFATA